MTSDQLSRPCPVCDQDDPAPFLAKAQLRLVRCRRCSMVYINPVPAQFASGEYYDKTAAEYYLSPVKLESDYADVRFHRELRLFRKHCRIGSVLDVGCSTGAFLFQLNRRFADAYEVLGVDASGPALDYAESRGVPVLRGHFLELEFGSRRFDAVTFWAVLEHLSEPKLFLEKAFSLLNPGGLCFVLVPNLGSLAARLLGGRYRYIYPQHLNYFSRATLARLVRLRFDVLESRTTHFNPVVVWQDWRGAGKSVSNEERGELLKRTTAWKQRPWLGPLKAAYRAAEASLALSGLADNLVFVLRRR
jgi:2-polyprenyl-3-methyl-5-hydroxy-6-metoxy-1,4-benzoquinol methylase